MPRQFFPIEKYHEVGQVAFVIAVCANLSHEVHAHGITTNGKKQTMPQRQNTGVAPNQVHGQGANGVAHDFANQAHRVIAEVQPVAFGYPQIQERHQTAHQQESKQKSCPTTT